MTHSFGCSHRHRKLVRAIVCKGADLRDANLWNANLTGADLRNANLRDANLWNANLTGADLTGADLRNADLRDANLRDADLRRANLTDADLRNANLTDADLRRANLTDADLTGAIGLVSHELPLAPPGKIAAWKLTTAGGAGIFRGGVEYAVGESYAAELDRDPSRGCASGLHVASLSWCMANWVPSHRLFACAMDPADVVIPLGSPGKFRTASLTVIGEMRV